MRPKKSAGRRKVNATTTEIDYKGLEKKRTRKSEKMKKKGNVGKIEKTIQKKWARKQRKIMASIKKKSAAKMAPLKAKAKREPHETKLKGRKTKETKLPYKDSDTMATSMVIASKIFVFAAPIFLPAPTSSAYSVESIPFVDNSKVPQE